MSPTFAGKNTLTGGNTFAEVLNGFLDSKEMKQSEFNKKPEKVLPCGNTLSEYAHDFMNVNVRDEYKGKTVDEVRAELDCKRSNIVLCFENIVCDANISGAIRNSNAFLAQEIIIVGRKKLDNRSSVGCQSYEHVIHTPCFEFLQEYKNKGYKIIAIENSVPRARSIVNYDWPEKVVAIFGSEGVGLSDEAISLADLCVYVPQIGSVRSLNVAVTSALVLYNYSVQWGQIS